MKTFGGLLFVIGLCVTIAQIRIYLEIAHWASFTIGDLLYHGFDIGHFQHADWPTAIITWLLERECGPALIVLGALPMLASPAIKRFDDTQALKIIHNLRAELQKSRQAKLD